MKKWPARPQDRQRILADRRNLKMAQSAHAYVRGSTSKFYEWLNSVAGKKLPAGPPIWICGDCHVGNLGPVASANGSIAIQIRDLDQTVIGNPVHDIIRLGLSMAMAARGSDLPGVITAHMMECIIDGYEAAFASDAQGETIDASSDMPKPVRTLMRQARAAPGSIWRTSGSKASILSSPLASGSGH